ncbi:flagellar biosynthetic protein FliO [Planosporangium sp. 12N6]|uniref:flagellar biosynthetic protein FliO n=1 Tax=Planosporangium spinosum TaxID=3402278 RepID=UPI003CE79AED
MIELTLRIVFSLLVVVGLMWGMARLARKPLGLRRGGGLIEVLGRQQLSRGASVAVVRIADKAMVLGVTDGQVTLIGETDLAAVEEYQPEEPVRREPLALDSLDAREAAPTATGPLGGSVLSAATWKQTLQFLRERTVRKS